MIKSPSEDSSPYFLVQSTFMTRAYSRITAPTVEDALAIAEVLGYQNFRVFDVYLNEVCCSLCYGRTWANPEWLSRTGNTF